MMKFALLESGSKGNSFFLQDGEVNLLIDCGGTGKYIKTCLQELDVSLDRITAVLITHEHKDHVAQINLFKHHTVYSPVPLKVETIRVKAEEPFQVGHLKISPLALSHDAPYTTGYVIENNLEKLVYITDTGYVKDVYLSQLSGADYYVFESNHDVEQLMHTSRPMYIKTRIASDEGHLCNEDCASLLNRLITERTKTVILAHISEEANTREKALQVNAEQIFCRHNGVLHPDFVLAAAGQFELIQGGTDNEKTDLGTCYCTSWVE